MINRIALKKWISLNNLIKNDNNNFNDFYFQQNITYYELIMLTFHSKIIETILNTI